MDNFTNKLKEAGFKGDVSAQASVLDMYSHDASLFEVRPQLVVSPLDTRDVELLVKIVNEERAAGSNLSLTARGGGTCMSGGAINDSIIVNFTRHLNKLEMLEGQSARVQPGLYYKEFEKYTLGQGLLLPSFPASKDICSLGGMVGNNAGGEKSLTWGKTINFVSGLRVILADGHEYEIRPLSFEQLRARIKKWDNLGQLYNHIFELIDNNYELIKQAKPKVSKNSTGYNLWDVWDRQTGIFDLTKLFVGSQGTLGLITDIELRLVKNQQYSGVLVCFMKELDELGDLINEVLRLKPTSFESFDNYTLNLSLKFFPYFRKSLGWWGLIKLGFKLIPDLLLLLRGIPKLILLIEFSGISQEEVNEKIKDAKNALTRFKLEAIEEDNTEAKAWKFRIMRRESFNLLRRKVKEKHTAPFIDDLVVPPKYLPEFLPKLRQVIDKYNLLATVAGHMGDGNFHIIPLMQLENKKDRDKLLPAMTEINDMVLRYGGSLSGEHNDGLVRGAWLEQMYGEEVYELFKRTKEIFDPQNIFNPHKKTDANWQWSYDHIRQKFDA